MHDELSASFPGPALDLLPLAIAPCSLGCGFVAWYFNGRLFLAVPLVALVGGFVGLGCAGGFVAWYFNGRLFLSVPIVALVGWWGFEAYLKR